MKSTPFERVRPGHALAVASPVVLADYVEEYTYELGAPHLSDAKAIKQYRRALAAKVGSTLVVLDQHDSGHWTVKELKTVGQRETYLNNKLQSICAQFFSVFPK